MHRIAAMPGGWDPDQEGVVLIDQTPAPIVFLTAADTEIQTLAAAISLLPPDFPGLRVANLLSLQQQLTIDTYAEDILEKAQVIIVRLLGGRAYWPYGLEVVGETARQTGSALFVLPGDDRPDPDLISHSTVSLGTVHQLWRYLTEGGLENFCHGLLFVAHTCLGRPYQPPAPQVVAQVGKWTSGSSRAIGSGRSSTSDEIPTKPGSTKAGGPGKGKVGILFYRAHYLAGNTQPIAALCQALNDRGLEVVPVFVASLRDLDGQAEIVTLFQPQGEPAVDLVLNTTSFAIAQLDQPSGFKPHTPDWDFAQAKTCTLWEQLNVPVLQVILSGGTVEQWQAQYQGLSPRDIAMNVALPEVDGRVITRAVSFKAVQTHEAQIETDVVTYQPVSDRIQFVADLAANWVRLGQTPVSERKIALILANYPSNDGRLANGVGLDTPASCVEILQALHQAGYRVENLPGCSDALMQRLTRGVTNSLEGRELRPVQQQLALEDYQHWFQQLPEAVRQGIQRRWGLPDRAFAIAGLQLGHIFVGIQPARGYDKEPALNYHAPDLEPTHDYLAFYCWLRQQFGVQAIVHLGKHGNLEWLPGKGIALSETCYPEVALGALPHFYPFIVNDPGEGSQAKRRSQAVILDHLTPPLTRAELYGPLHQLEALVDEYYEAESLNPSRLGLLRDRIVELIQETQLATDLRCRNRQGGQPGTRNQEPTTTDAGVGAVKQMTHDFPNLLTQIDGYLCELKEAQIRDGLHIFGQCPQGRQLRDLIVAIARQPGPGRLGLTRALAQDLGLEIDPLLVNPTQGICHGSYRTAGDAIADLELQAANLVQALLPEALPLPDAPPLPATQTELRWISAHLLPALQRTQEECTHLLRGLEGGYVPPGAAGAPTRGRPDVLPTGRNFYSVDIRAIPTETAWSVGRKAAEALIERYTQEQGEYPKTLGLSIWGTSCMRTGGDDLAEALALVGVQPVWDGVARRVIDFEILPLSVLGRPRVDVTLRISGFFRDAFPNLIDLFDQAVRAVAALDEPTEMNPLAAQVRQETTYWQSQGLDGSAAQARSQYRIFGSKPGAYGAGLQGLIEAHNWNDETDLAHAYMNWSSYAYTGAGAGHSAPEAFSQRLSQMQIVLHNQDNREHDLLDSDDYYQFQGGLTAAVRSVRGEQPLTYFGDHSQIENPKVHRLQAEIARVYRSRVVNPKWIAGVMRHGYKGAFELAATVDYLFAYDATAHCVEDFMYQGVADAYLFDETVQAFIHEKNPWALREMAERLLEAHQRQLWQAVTPATLDQLRAIVHQAEATIEAIDGPGC